MRKLLVVSLVVLLLVVLAAPSMAGGPNDNGKGNVFERNEGTYSGLVYFPVCVGGDQVGLQQFQGTSEFIQLWQEKTDTEGMDRSRYSHEESFVSDDGQYGKRYEMTIKTNSLDLSDLGFWISNADKRSETIAWSDGSGVYAQRIYSQHSTYNQHGDLTSNKTEGGFDIICLRSGPAASG